MRQIKQTGVIFGEGGREAGWLGHLGELYCSPNKYVRIINAHGGKPVHMINVVARNELKNRDYDSKHVLFDTDYATEKVQAAENAARRLNIETIESEPSTDYKLVELLTEDEKTLARARKSSHDAKVELAQLCGLDHENDEIDWDRFFPKQLLESTRSSNPWLNRQIGLFE